MLRYLIKLTHQNVIFPFYHIISDDAPAHVKHLYRAKSVKEFVRDLDFLLRYYQPYSLEDIKTYVKDGKKLSKSGFYLSFDDGLAEMYDIVFPILLKKGIPCAFFCNTAFIDNHDMFYRYKVSLLMEHIQRSNDIASQRWTKHRSIKDIKTELLQMKYQDVDRIHAIANQLGLDFEEYLNTKKPYMTKDQINILKNHGFDIGAHSIDHPLYADISEEGQIQQTKESMDKIQKDFMTENRIFAFPFTEYGVKSSFFKRISVDMMFGTAGIKIDEEPNLLHRISMESGQKKGSSILYRQYYYYLLKALIHKNVRKRD